MEQNGLNAAPTLDELIEVCLEGERRFRSCSERAQRSELKQLFAWRADEFRQLAQAFVRTGGVDPAHAAAIGSRTDARPCLAEPDAPIDDRLLLDRCAEGEQEALDRFSAALDGALSADLRTILDRERDRVRRHHAQIHALRTRLAGAD